jgi:hypothetical protein
MAIYTLHRLRPSSFIYLYSKYFRMGSTRNIVCWGDFLPSSLTAPSSSFFYFLLFFYYRFLQSNTSYWAWNQVGYTVRDRHSALWLKDIINKGKGSNFFGYKYNPIIMCWPFQHIMKESWMCVLSKILFLIIQLGSFPYTPVYICNGQGSMTNQTYCYSRLDAGRFFSPTERWHIFTDGWWWWIVSLLLLE